MNYIRLTEVETGRTVWVNAAHITAVELDNGFTTIALTSKTGYDVAESADNVLAMIARSR
jgi:uncharacterized protein YlzI (FlbEa/FlbD family)